MPVNFLSEAERLRFNSFPSDLSAEDLIGFFTFSPSDLRQIPANAAAANWLGFALQLVLLRFLGFHLPELSIAAVPIEVIDFVAGPETQRQLRGVSGGVHRNGDGVGRPGVAAQHAAPSP